MTLGQEQSAVGSRSSCETPLINCLARSNASYNWYLERKTPQPDQLCLLARAVECMHSHITQFWESPWEAPRQRQEQFKQ
eukprot:906856-Pelagomonas_calceolata.AAC.6